MLITSAMTLTNKKIAWFVMANEQVNTKQFVLHWTHGKLKLMCAAQHHPVKSNSSTLRWGKNLGAIAQKISIWLSSGSWIDPHILLVVHILSKSVCRENIMKLWKQKKAEILTCFLFSFFIENSFASSGDCIDNGKNVYVLNIFLLW